MKGCLVPFDAPRRAQFRRDEAGPCDRSSRGLFTPTS
jgi:hypothetical protein